MSEKTRGLYFEEFDLGDVFISGTRTITEGDINEFATLSGDFNKIHTDTEYAKDTIYEERIAHGLLGLSVISGLAASLGFTEGTTIALREIFWKFKHPVKIGDTIKSSFTVEKKKDIVDNKGGLVTFLVKVTNQEGRAVQNGRWVMIIMNKP